MHSDFPVVLDANVLIQAAVRDTLLRLSEQRLFLCRWSEEILEEVRRTLTGKRGLSEDKVDSLLEQLRTHFPDACVEPGYKEMIPAIKNDEKDRHVIAAAVFCKAEVILTYNVRHFPEESVRPFNICVKTPDEYLLDLYSLSPEKVVHVLHEQGEGLNPPRTIQQVLKSLATCQCVSFAQTIQSKLCL